MITTINPTLKKQGRANEEEKEKKKMEEKAGARTWG